MNIETKTLLFRSMRQLAACQTAPGNDNTSSYPAASSTPGASPAAPLGSQAMLCWPSEAPKYLALPAAAAVAPVAVVVAAVAVVAASAVVVTVAVAALRLLVLRLCNAWFSGNVAYALQPDLYQVPHAKFSVTMDVITDPRIDEVLHGPFCCILGYASVALLRTFQTEAPAQEMSISSNTEVATILRPLVGFGSCLHHL
jgi:hypothetical protein